ncbi:unnamed protein product [Amoebophrya sp. A120]|nr:unnamed protein product [Amoebophrya sp. A120]|eukprot:GSA120T00005344001.1
MPAVTPPPRVLDVESFDGRPSTNQLRDDKKENFRQVSLAAVKNVDTDLDWRAKSSGAPPYFGFGNDVDRASKRNAPTQHGSGYNTTNVPSIQRLGIRDTTRRRTIILVGERKETHASPEPARGRAARDTLTIYLPPQRHEQEVQGGQIDCKPPCSCAYSRSTSTTSRTAATRPPSASQEATELTALAKQKRNRRGKRRARGGGRSQHDHATLPHTDHHNDHVGDQKDSGSVENFTSCETRPMNFTKGEYSACSDKPGGGATGNGCRIAMEMVVPEPHDTRTPGTAHGEHEVEEDGLDRVGQNAGAKQQHVPIKKPSSSFKLYVYSSSIKVADVLEPFQRNSTAQNGQSMQLLPMQYRKRSPDETYRIVSEFSRKVKELCQESASGTATMGVATSKRRLISDLKQMLHEEVLHHLPRCNVLDLCCVFHSLARLYQKQEKLRDKSITSLCDGTFLTVLDSEATRKVSGMWPRDIANILCVLSAMKTIPTKTLLAAFSERVCTYTRRHQFNCFDIAQVCMAAGRFVKLGRLHARGHDSSSRDIRFIKEISRSNSDSQASSSTCCHLPTDRSEWRAAASVKENREDPALASSFLSAEAIAALVEEVQHVAGSMNAMDLCHTIRGFFDLRSFRRHAVVGALGRAFGARLSEVRERFKVEELCGTLQCLADLEFAAVDRGRFTLYPLRESGLNMSAFMDQLLQHFESCLRTKNQMTTRAFRQVETVDLTNVCGAFAKFEYHPGAEFFDSMEKILRSQYLLLELNSRVRSIPLLLSSYADLRETVSPDILRIFGDCYHQISATSCSSASTSSYTNIDNYLFAFACLQLDPGREFLEDLLLAIPCELSKMTFSEAAHCLRAIAVLACFLDMGSDQVITRTSRQARKLKLAAEKLAAMSNVATEGIALRCDEDEQGLPTITYGDIYTVLVMKCEAGFAVAIGPLGQHQHEATKLCGEGAANTEEKESGSDRNCQISECNEGAERNDHDQHFDSFSSPTKDDIAIRSARGDHVPTDDTRHLDACGVFSLSVLFQYHTAATIWNKHKKKNTQNSARWWPVLSPELEQAARSDWFVRGTDGHTSCMEENVADALEHLGLSYIREYVTPDRVWSVDFLVELPDQNVQVAVEVDGEQHYVKNRGNRLWCKTGRTIIRDFFHQDVFPHFLVLEFEEYERHSKNLDAMARWVARKLQAVVSERT